MTYKQDLIQEADRDDFFRSHYVDIESKAIYKKLSFFSFLILLFFMSFDSSATECVTPRGGYYHPTYEAEFTYYTHDGAELETCVGNVIMSATEYGAMLERSTSMQGLEDLLTTLFAFDAEVFAIVEITLILAFLTAHYAGRVVRWLGKS